MTKQTDNKTKVENLGKIPRLRFPEFHGEWEDKKLGAIADRVMYGMNAAAIPFDGINKYLRITDINDDSRKFEANPLTSPSGEIEDKYKLQKGDIVFARTGASVGKSYLYTPNDGNLLFAGFLIKFSIINANPYFIFSQTLKSNYDKWIKKMSMRSGQPGINAEEYKELVFNIPSIAEQQKIADFLTLIDEHIEKSRKIINQHETEMRIIREKIFNQQIRFKDENGNYFTDWIYQRLGKMSHITTGRLDANAMIENGDYRFYTCAKDFYKIDKYAFDTEALLISGNGANVGYIHYYKGRFNAYQRTYVLDDFRENILYVKYFLDTYLEKRINLEKKEGNTPYIVLSTLSEMEIKIPCIKEQAKIANFLTSLDAKIETEKQLLEQYKQQKTYLLQNLFI